MAALARWCMRHRLAVLLLWLVTFAGAGTAAAVWGSAYSTRYEIPGTESGRAAELLGDAFPGQAGDSDTVVWRTGGTVRDAATRERMTGALERLTELPRVASVTGPYQDGGERQISRDGHTAYATVSYDAPADELSPGEVREVVDTARAVATDELQVAVGGPAVGMVGTPSSHLAEAVGLTVAAIVLFLAFGSLAATALPLITALVSVGTAYLAIGLLGHAMTVADFAPMLGTLIGLGVGIDYALFIVTRHRRGLRQGLGVEESAERALATSGRAVIFAGVTVCIALLGMLVLRLGFLDGVAVAASLTVVLTVLASVTLLPALLAYIRLHALSRRERDRLHTHGPQPTGAHGFGARWSDVVERHPRLLGAVAAVLMAVLALPTLGLHLGTSDQGNHPATSTTRQAYDMLAEGFGPGVNGPLTLVGELTGPDDRPAFDRLAQTLRETPGIAETTGVTLDSDGRTGVITVIPETAPQSKDTSDLVERLRTRVLPDAAGGSSLDVHVGGVTAAYDDFASVILGKLPLFIGVVIALGCLLLLLAFRSFGIPLKAAAMNVAAVSASFGVVVAIFQWGWGSEAMGLGGAGPIEPFLPVIMVAVLFGLSMDYQVFMVSRMYEEWQATGDNRRAVRVGLAETGTVINSAAVIMIAVFGAFVLSGDRIIAMFGIGLSVAVALDAFLLRTLLVPALMHLLGGANWWLPGWLERRLPRLSIEPPESELGTTPHGAGSSGVVGPRRGGREAGSKVP